MQCRNSLDVSQESDSEATAHLNSKPFLTGCRRIIRTKASDPKQWLKEAIASLQASLAVSVVCQCLQLVRKQHISLQTSSQDCLLDFQKRLEDSQDCLIKDLRELEKGQQTLGKNLTELEEGLKTLGKGPRTLRSGVGQPLTMVEWELTECWSGSSGKIPSTNLGTGIECLLARSIMDFVHMFKDGPMQPNHIDD